MEIIIKHKKLSFKDKFFPKTKDVNSEKAKEFRKKLIDYYINNDGIFSKKTNKNVKRSDEDGIKRISIKSVRKW